MQSFDVYLPEDTSQMPQYKIENRYYRVDTLERVPQEVSTFAFGMFPGILNSKPLLVRKTNGREWILFDTDDTELRKLGSSNYFTSSGPFLPPIEMKILNTQDRILDGFENTNLPPFDPRIKSMIENAIASNRPLPVADDTVVLDPEIRMYVAYPINLQVTSSQLAGQPRIHEEIGQLRTQTTSNQVQNISTFSQPEKDLHQLSYETLVKQLYGIPVGLPDFLILNGLKVKFIPFSQLNTIQIERYIIEPLLQPWAGPPLEKSGNTPVNRILTIFGKNGMTYVVKALYDPNSNQIYSPV